MFYVISWIIYVKSWFLREIMNLTWNREFYVKSLILREIGIFRWNIFLIVVVFVAQIQAGMWRRNGHSLIEQAMAYHDSR